MGKSLEIKAQTSIRIDPAIYNKALRAADVQRLNFSEYVESCLKKELSAMDTMTAEQLRAQLGKYREDEQVARLLLADLEHDEEVKKTAEKEAKEAAKARLEQEKSTKTVEAKETDAYNIWFRALPKEKQDQLIKEVNECLPPGKSTMEARHDLRVEIMKRELRPAAAGGEGVVDEPGPALDSGN